jgi:general secretion pathway protein J
VIRRESGFTLFEVLVAITITALLLTTIFGVFSSISGAKERVETDGEGFHQARVLFDRIGREVRSVHYNAAKPGTRLLGGISEEGRPFLEITTTATTPQSGRRGGISVIRYELEDDPETPEQRRVLMRSESPLLQAALPDQNAYRLATGLDEMIWRFFHNGEWHEQWNSTQQGLPHMVALSVTVLIGDIGVPFLSSFEIPVYR